MNSTKIGELPHDDSDALSIEEPNDGFCSPEEQRRLLTLLESRPTRFKEREDRVEKGIEAGVDALDALEGIKKDKEYRYFGYRTFEEYCRQRWGLGADMINQKMAALRFWEKELKPALPTNGRQTQPPKERVTRDIVRLPPADRAAVGKEIAKETAKTGRLDSKIIKRAVQKSARLAPSRNKGKDSLSKYLIRSEEQQASDIWLNFRRYILKNVSSPRVRKLVIRLMIEQLTALEEDEKTS